MGGSLGSGSQTFAPKVDVAEMMDSYRKQVDRRWRCSNHGCLWRLPRIGVCGHKQRRRLRKARRLVAR
jgi:hypothetical protein